MWVFSFFNFTSRFRAARPVGTDIGNWVFPHEYER